MRNSFSIGVIIAAWIFLLLSCEKKQQKVVVNLDDLRPKPTRTYQIDPDTVQIPAFTPQDLSPSFRIVFEEIYQEDRFYPNDATIYPTRFGPKEYISMIQKSDDQSDISTWYFMKFKDSIMTDNALLNWLDCFGAQCQSLNLASGEAILEHTGQIWTNDSLIVAYFSRRDGGKHSKEARKLDLYFEKKSRYSFGWEQGKSAVWKGNKFEKRL